VLPRFFLRALFVIVIKPASFWSAGGSSFVSSTPSVYSVPYLIVSVSVYDVGVVGLGVVIAMILAFSVMSFSNAVMAPPGSGGLVCSVAALGFGDVGGVGVVVLVVGGVIVVNDWRPPLSVQNCTLCQGPFWIYGKLISNILSIIFR
jgi:hypothetical protein